MIIREEKEIKGIQIGKKEVKLSLFADDMILYIENLQILSKTYQSQSVNLSMSKDTKSIHRNHLHSYALMMKNQKVKLRHHSHSPLQQKNKYLVLNLPKATKELYTENYKTLMKEIKDYINKWREVPSS